MDEWLDNFHLSLLKTRPVPGAASLSLLQEIETKLDFLLEPVNFANSNLVTKLAEYSVSWLSKLLDASLLIIDDDSEDSFHSIGEPEACPWKTGFVADVIAKILTKLAKGPVEVAADDCDVRTFEFQGGRLQLLESPTGVGGFEETDTGGNTWSAAIHMADLIDSGKVISVKDRRVLELGSGTGLAGFAALLLGKATSVTLTDYHQGVLNTLKANMELNIPAQARDRVLISKLDWRDPSPREVEPHSFDTVLAADCVFEVEHAELVPLVADRFLNLEASITRDKNGEQMVATPEFHAIVPLRLADRFQLAVRTFEKNMESLVNKGRFLLIEAEDFMLGKAQGGITYRRYRFARPSVVKTNEGRTVDATEED